MKLTVGYCSIHGKNKQKCEDSILIGNNVINEKEGIIELKTPCIICLCDGVGGYAGGQEASLFVTRELSNVNLLSSVEDIKELFIEINNRLIAQGQKTPELKRMGTTATALFINDDSFYVAHVGNTRLYAKTRYIYFSDNAWSYHASMVHRSSSKDICERA